MKKIGNENSLYVAYGSNLNLKQMEYRCPYAKPLGPAELPGYRLLFRGGNGGAVATVEPCNDSSVPVLVWEITPRCLEALDRYEGFPVLYRRETVTVSYEDNPLEAMVYIMNDGRTLGLPGSGYLNSILEGYSTAGFDTAVLDEAVEYSGSAEEKTRSDSDMSGVGLDMSDGAGVKIKWSSQTCIEAVEQFIEEHDRFPRTEDFLKNKNLPLPPTFKHHMSETIGKYLSRHPRYDTASERYVIGRYARLVD